MLQSLVEAYCFDQAKRLTWPHIRVLHGAGCWYPYLWGGCGTRRAMRAGRARVELGGSSGVAVGSEGGGPPLVALLWGRHYGLCCRL